MIVATPDTINTLLPTLQGGETVRMVGSFTNVLLDRLYPFPVAFEASGATVSGLTIRGGNLIIRGGTVRAIDGYEGFAGKGYGAFITGSRIAIEGTRFIESNRCVVANGCRDLSIRYSRFEQGQDGIIAAGGANLDFSYNEFIGVLSKPSSCKFPDGSTLPGLSKRDCTARGGTWLDGWHQDAIQVRNGIVGLRCIGNVIEGVSQGIGQMDSPTDAPLQDVLIDDNDVTVTGYHSITVGQFSTGVEITRNVVRQLYGRKTPIRGPSESIMPGNTMLAG